MKSRTEPSARRAGRLRALVTIGLTIGMCPDVWADEASDIRSGQELASKVCSPCHGGACGPGRLSRKSPMADTPRQTRC
jgi:hypothetical protein